jgi:hypothetical protein
MNRLRPAYLTIAPALEPYFTPATTTTSRTSRPAI